IVAGKTIAQESSHEKSSSWRIELLRQKGIHPEQIETKTISDSTDVTKSILEEARNGGYLTLVLGRCDFSRVREFFLGSTTSRIINQGAGLAICVVE
ncbi:MAG: universal stress protein, partial [Syntrophales bacterium LBB04]|nr:universal stress protein [Syntrophales bacterium LBB04]